MSGYRPSYLNVFLTFARNSLVRDMSFRTNFILQCISTISWTVMNIGFYLIVFQYTDSIGKGTGWGRDEFFVFLATTWIINILVQTFFMPKVYHMLFQYTHKQPHLLKNPIRQHHSYQFIHSMLN